MSTGMNTRTMGNAAKAVGAVFSLLALSACVTTTPQADGSTRVNVSAANALGANQAAPVQVAAVAAPVLPVAAAPATGKKLNRKAKFKLEQALSCKPFQGSLGKDMKAAGQATDQPFNPAPALTVFGLPVSKVSLSLDSGEQLYTSYFWGQSKQQLIKAAGLKLGNDKVGYGRPGKTGTLTLNDADMSITCTVDTEGDYSDTAPAKKSKKK